jgi:hypothetical protein
MIARIQETADRLTAAAAMLGARRRDRHRAAQPKALAMIPGTPSRMRHPDLFVLSRAPAQPAPALPAPARAPGRLRGHAALLASLQQGSRHG